jgi:N-acyl-D-amino-acid deacylase
MPRAIARSSFALSAIAALAAGFAVFSCTGSPTPSSNAAAVFDVVLANGTIYDGSGSAPFAGDVGISGDRIAALRRAGEPALVGRRTVDVSGLAVAPGFVNMLSWATDSLIVDGRGLSDIEQGVTLEVFGEGWSLGPLNAAMKEMAAKEQGDIRYTIDWTTLGEYLESLERRGISPNVASFVGATTIRVHELGFADRPPTAEELARMQELVRQAMREGALGVGSSLIYAPAFYAKTDELVALMQAAAEFDGMYISHLRSEGNRWFEALDELIDIARRAQAPAEVYHLKAAGRSNWGKLDGAIDKIEAARAAGLRITADMYTYTAGATGLDAAMPPWVQEGGTEAWIARLKDPAIRARVIAEMKTDATDWENLYAAAGTADGLLLAGFKTEALKPLTGKTLAEVARMRGTSPEDTAIDLVIEDGTRVETVYFLMDEANVARQVAIPWVSFGSDAAAPAPEGVFLRSSQHPRAYGNVARLLGKYVRDEKRLPLAEAIRKLTSQPAENLKIRQRGRIREGYFADLAIFDPASVGDRATFSEPHQLAVGMRHVVVNGRFVLLDGEPTAERPGRVVRGPGWLGWREGLGQRRN